jgi:hypothetical protein
MTAAITDSHDNGISGVLIDDVVVDVLGEVSVSGLAVAELCTEMDWISRTRNGMPCMHVVATFFST